jgi:hypothetical protein
MPVHKSGDERDDAQTNGPDDEPGDKGQSFNRFVEIESVLRVCDRDLKEDYDREYRGSPDRLEPRSLGPLLHLTLRRGFGALRSLSLDLSRGKYNERTYPFHIKPLVDSERARRRPERGS